MRTCTQTHQVVCLHAKWGKRESIYISACMDIRAVKIGTFVHLKKQKRCLLFREKYKYEIDRGHYAVISLYHFCLLKLVNLGNWNKTFCRKCVIIPNIKATT